MIINTVLVLTLQTLLNQAFNLPQRINNNFNDNFSNIPTIYKYSVSLFEDVDIRFIAF